MDTELCEPMDPKHPDRWRAWCACETVPKEKKTSITFKDRLLVYGWVVKDGTVMRMKQTVLVMRKMTPIRLKIISNDTGCITDFLLIICSIFFYENEVINYNKSIVMWLEI